jgi:arylsulfatase A-like enzyme
MRYSRRRVLQAAPIVLSGCRRSERPNILFAIADDWSWSHTGVYGNFLVCTPVFDRVGREGVLFAHCFQHPFDSSRRAARH